MAVERHLRALEASIDGPLTLAELTHRMHHAGFGLIVLFLCVPFLQPLPLAGLSTVLGVFIALQGLQLVRGRKEPHLPDWLGRRRLEAKTLHLLLGAARRFFALADRFTRPRWRPLAANERAVGAAWVLCGLALALPFPIPMSNMICASPAALLALALLEEDGLIALLGWLGVLAMIAFHIGLLLLGAEGTRALWRAAFT
ncbi:MAG: exopolysaccharide biosynthesis protein [Elusimicrobiota bacterium]|nr:exopolysaccharide biosynthesis protein [Elusimicrobiota bacterium]